MLNSTLRLDGVGRSADRRDPEPAGYLPVAGCRSVPLPRRCSAAGRSTSREASQRADAAGLEDAVRGSAVTFRPRPHPRPTSSIGRESPERPCLPAYARTDVLLLDDWGLAKVTAPQRRDLFDILDDRHDRRSTVVTSQLPVDLWHKMIGEPTHADAILDRLVHTPIGSHSRASPCGESPPKQNREPEREEVLRIGRADATAPAARLGLYNANRLRRRGRPGLDPRVQSGPAARLDIGRRVSDASTVKTAHPPRNPP